MLIEYLYSKSNLLRFGIGLRFGDGLQVRYKTIIINSNFNIIDFKEKFKYK